MAWLSKFATHALSNSSQSKLGLESETEDKFRVQRKSCPIGQGLETISAGLVDSVVRLHIEVHIEEQRNFRLVMIILRG